MGDQFEKLSRCEIWVMDEYAKNYKFMVENGRLLIDKQLLQSDFWWKHDLGTKMKSCKIWSKIPKFYEYMCWKICNEALVRLGIESNLHKFHFLGLGTKSKFMEKLGAKW